MLRIAARRLPRVAVQQRFSSSLKEGSVAQSKGFAEKERSQEAQFVRQHEAEQLRKMKATMEANLEKISESVTSAQAEIAELEKKISEAEKSKK